MWCCPCGCYRWVRYSRFWMGHKRSSLLAFQADLCFAGSCRMNRSKGASSAPSHSPPFQTSYRSRFGGTPPMGTDDRHIWTSQQTEHSSPLRWVPGHWASTAWSVESCWSGWRSRWNESGEGTQHSTRTEHSWEILHGVGPILDACYAEVESRLSSHWSRRTKHPVEII